MSNPAENRSSSVTLDLTDAELDQVSGGVLVIEAFKNMRTEQDITVGKGTTRTRASDAFDNYVRS